MKNNIKISLNHDYISIKDERYGVEMQLPIRTAQIIADMWQASGNGDEEIKQYCSYGGKANPSYDISVYIRQLEHNNIFKWIHKTLGNL